MVQWERLLEKGALANIEHRAFIKDLGHGRVSLRNSEDLAFRGGVFVLPPSSPPNSFIVRLRPDLASILRQNLEQCRSMYTHAQPFSNSIQSPMSYPGSPLVNEMKDPNDNGTITIQM